MANDAQTRVLKNIVSPYGLAIISYVFFLFACSIPPATYSHYMAEPDLMFLDSTTILFYTLCVAGFMVGVRLFEHLFPSVWLADRRFETKPYTVTFLLPPVVLGISFSVLSCILMLKSNPLIIPLLLGQQANELGGFGSVGLDTSGSMNYSVSFLTGILWWAVWRYYQLGARRNGQRVIQFMLLLGLLAAFVSSSLSVSRHALIVIITGLPVLHLIRKIFRGQLTWKFVGKVALIFVLSGSFFFVLVSLVKGRVDLEGQIDTLIGYSVASYNRLAALLQGRLHYEYSGRGIYFSNFLSFNHAFNVMIPYGKVMNIPDFFDWWGSAFSSVGRAGLNPNLIFCGTFGEIYIETGWLAPVFMFFYGLLYGLMWFWMKKGSTIGVLLYPYFAYCILFWFTGNGLFDQDIVALILDAAILSAYELLLKRRAEGSLQAPCLG